MCGRWPFSAGSGIDQAMSLRSADGDDATLQGVQSLLLYTDSHKSKSHLLLGGGVGANRLLA